MKKIFSNTWFKCIVTLATLMLILGGTLAILNDLLYVSPEERTSRAIKKIYGEEKTFSIIYDADSEDKNANPEKYENDYGTISKVYEIEGHYLFQSIGKEGYKNGTITLWIQIIDNEITKVILENYDKQTLMSKLGGAFYDNFLVDVTTTYNNQDFFTPHLNDKNEPNYNPVSGATKSANAGCNAVNCVIEFIGKGGLNEG